MRFHCRLVSVFAGMATLLMTASLLFAEFRYCSAVAGPNPAAPQGCQNQCQVVGFYSQQIPGGMPAWVHGDILKKCTNQQPSDGCYDYNYSTQPNPTCNRVQQACGAATLLLRPDGLAGCAGMPMAGATGVLPGWNPGFDPATDVHCNNIFWLQAQGGMANGVNCTGTTPGLY